MENKKLDKVFRDKLKDLKVSAPKDAWEAISERLPRKKKRRPIVLWWSAAAVLLALLASSVFLWTVTETVPENIQMVDSEKTSETVPENIQLIETEIKPEISTKNSYETKLAAEDNKLENMDSTELQNDSSSNKGYQSKSEFDTFKNKAIANKSVQEKAIDLREINEVKSESKSSSNQPMAQNNTENKTDSEKYKETLFAKQHPSENVFKEMQNASNQQLAQEALLNQEEDENKEIQEATSLLDDKSLLAAEENKEKKSKEKEGKWSVGPQVAPVYYNSVSAGSSLDNQFNNSGKDGGVNMSLGLQVAYQLSDNWQVRSGVHRMNVGYATNNVQVGYSDPNLAIANISYNNASAGDIVVTAFSNENLSNIRASHLGNKIEVLNLEGNTQLKQNITYLEVPIEIERKIIQSDFEWTIIGGVSSLFLTDNDVYVQNDDYSHQIGSANNLEKTSFTTNIGMGFGYNFTKNLHLKLEPMFKYQLNAYTNSVDFKPYMFGLYTGINWKLD